MNDDDCETGTCVNATGNTKKCQGDVAVNGECTNNWDCASNSCGVVDEDSGGDGSLKKCAGKYPLIVAVF